MSDTDTKNKAVGDVSDGKTTSEPGTSLKPPGITLPSGGDGVTSDDDRLSQGSPTGSVKSVKERITTRRPLAPELAIKARSQRSRVKVLKSYYEDISTNPDRDQAAIKMILDSAEEIHGAFIAAHEFLEASWPIRHLDHEYFAEEVFSQEAAITCQIRQIAAIRLQQPDNHPANQSVREANIYAAKLPKITLPTFSGDYQHWTSFAALFKSMVIDNHDLNDLARLHYLRSSVTQKALSLISHIPVTDTAFPMAWKALEERYGNKRVLIDAQLAILLQEHAAANKQRESAVFLQQLITGVDSALSALALIGQSTDIGDCLIVYNTVRQFSPRTRELWESSVSQMTTYPTYDQLKEFITHRSRTLEQTESAHSSSNAANQVKSASRSSNHAAARPSTSSAKQQKQFSGHQFQCDCCPEKHFIATCATFRGLPPQDRRETISQRRLCSNCLGRHNSDSCKSTTRCKTCNQQHHTMLHDALTKQDLPAPTFKVEPRRFTPSNAQPSAQPSQPRPQ